LHFFTDQHGRELGCLLTLHDVTDRELRRQRLEVLNRVLRHNLRNSVDVIKSNAEVMAMDAENKYADRIIDSADGLAELGSKARSIDQLLGETVKNTEKDLSAVVSELAETDTEVTVTADVPDSALLVTDWRVLQATIETALRNAIEHANEAVTLSVTETTDRYEIAIADNGSGIPESELASIDAGSETPLQHGTGLDLWHLKWGMTRLHGDLSFDTADGTTVRMTVPDRTNF